MARVLLDDGFTSHPKIRALTDRQFRVWVRLLCYCAETDDPSVDVGVMGEVAGLTRETVRRFAELRLLDAEADGWVVHDFWIYNGGTADERVAAYFRLHPEATANEVVRALPIRRNEVLEAVRRYRNGSQGTTGGTTGRFRGGTQSGSQSGTPSTEVQEQPNPGPAPVARARAKRPPASGAGAGAAGLTPVGQTLSTMGLDAPIE